MDKKKMAKLRCAVEATVAVLGGKYKAIIIWHLNDAGVLRYSEIQRSVPHATPKMLAQQLKELEEDGIINRKVYPVVPPRSEYTLTDYGRTLVPIVLAMSDWGDDFFARNGIPNPDA